MCKKLPFSFYSSPPKSLNSYNTIEDATSDAVSVLSILGPKDTDFPPILSIASISLSSNPPSGPTKIPIVFIFTPFIACLIDFVLSFSLLILRNFHKSFDSSLFSPIS